MPSLPIQISSDQPSSSDIPSSSLSFTKDDRKSPSPHPSTDPVRSYRAAVALPFLLREHCQIYFEEAVYNSALNLLLSILTSGALPPSERLAVIAPPHFLAFLATLAAHPTLTSRAKTAERATTAALSLRYLRILLSTVEPSETGFSDAFVFASTSQSTRGGRISRRRVTEETVFNEESSEINNEFANVNSLWQRGEDFWHIVGWAFNCSILYKKRWEVWATWLEFILDLLEKDWETRDSVSAASIIANFIRGNRTGGFEKRILRSIFADGSTRSLSEFREIWPNETKSLKKDDDVATGAAPDSSNGGPDSSDAKLKNGYQKIDIEADNYGSYMDDEVLSDLSNTSRSASPDATGPVRLGGARSIALRLRLLSLLCTVSYKEPSLFIPLKPLYDLITEHIRSLPLPIFASILTPSLSGLGIWSVESAQALVQYLLITIIDAKAPQPSSDRLDQDHVQEHYLPYAANASGLGDNARVSICVEYLLRLLARSDNLDYTEELGELAVQGIEARRKKANGRGRGRKGDDLVWLEGSAQRILATVMIKPTKG